MITDIPVLGVAPAPVADSQERVYVETYGCQMNVSDSEIVVSLLRDAGFGLATDAESADIVLINTCAIRENAEQRVRRRLVHLRALKHRRHSQFKIGVLGCMAERLRHKLLEEERLVDVVAGPDAYRDLPRLLRTASESGQAAVNVLLSREETYADVSPVRYASNGMSAFVSIMRGCDNMCSFCVVPFTRGRERSRPAASILTECSDLVDQGYREVTVLGQNVNSYQDGDVDFAELLHRISLLSDDLRIRYSTSHPKDCSKRLLQVHRDRPNICNFIHLPVQHGNSDVLARMRRGYTTQGYMRLIDRARSVVPGISFSTDIIAGFCGETEAEHKDTLALLREVRYDHAFMFMYSERPGTYAARKLKDDVPDEVKKRRLSEIIEVQSKIALARNEAEVGRTHTVLVEGPSRRNADQFCGRTDTNKMVVFPRQSVQKGQYADVTVTHCTSATLLGTIANHPLNLG